MSMGSADKKRIREEQELSSPEDSCRQKQARLMEFEAGMAFDKAQNAGAGNQNLPEFCSLSNEYSMLLKDPWSWEDSAGFGFRSRAAIRKQSCILDYLHDSALDDTSEKEVAEQQNLQVEERKSSFARWYYRPEESIGGRRQFHGAKELFLSDHFDEQSADTIEGKCSVHTFKNYTKLDSVGSEDYFCRFEYNAKTGGFTPDRVAVHCKCEMPYNPDVLMAQCEACKDWFHPPCVNLTTEQVKKMDHFFCSDCIKEDDMKLRNSGKDSPPLEQKSQNDESCITRSDCLPEESFKSWD